MFQKEEHISRLIVNYLKGELSVTGTNELNAWLKASERNREWFGQFCEQQKLKEELRAFDTVRSEHIWKKTNKKINEKPNPVRKTHLWPRIGIAAAVAVMISCVALFLYKNHLNKPVTFTNDIAPGKQGATLTLASGKKINLSDAASGKLTEQSGVTITKSANGQLVYELKKTNGTTADPGSVNTLSTARGQTYNLRLPDGTLVSLNAASSLTYPASLTEQGKRRVKLEGEAYFQVARDKAHPFIVETDRQQVEVLGTHFNINAYKDEPSTKTTLLEGSVRIAIAPGKEIVIKPDQQSIVSASGIKVIPVIAETYIDWKEGGINFRKENLTSIMRKVSRWYNVEVEYRDKVDPEQTFTGYVTRTGNISAVLDALSKISDLKFQIEGKKITVFK